MPQLVLFEDDGRELFRGQISHQNVELIRGFIKRNLPAFQAAAAYKRALEAAGDLFAAFTPPPRPIARPRARRRP